MNDLEGARLLVDHRSDIHREIEWIAEPQLVHRAQYAAQHLVGDVFLKEQHPQRRAALSGEIGRAHV